MIAARRALYMRGFEDDFNNTLEIMETDDKAKTRAGRLKAAARRALTEAAARRKASGEAAKPREIGGPAGPEPTRYGDWERKGIASDF